MDIQKLTVSIQQHEGSGPNKADAYFPYTDQTGHISIGHGINLSAGITSDEEQHLFSNRLHIAIRAAETETWWQYVSDNDARSRAMVEIVYNLGANGVAGFHDALAAMQRGDWHACAAGFLDSLWHKQVGKRAENLAAMILLGSDPQ